MDARRLLLVEDDAALRTMLAWELDDRGFRVSAAGDCAGALRLAARQGFDGALLDYHLPDGTAVELTRALRGLFPGLAVVVVSADCTETTASSALEAGADRFFRKPAPLAPIAEVFWRGAVR